MSKGFYEFFCPVKVVAGEAALEHIPYELTNLGASRPLLVTDKGVRGAGLVDHVVAACEAGGIKVDIVFEDVPPDSAVEVVREIAQLYNREGCDALIGVGGGSVIDTCKGVNILVSEGGLDLSRYAGAGVLKRPLKPFVVVPTTAGTGSEVTSVAVIADRVKGVKLPFSSGYLLPNAAILDPRMTLTLPPHITAATAMDAMTHAVEAYTCLARNPLSSAYASAAVKKISENLPRVLENGADVQARLELAQASTMAGIAFSNSMVGLVHALGHALGAVCHIPHGVCMNLFLPYVLEFNLAKGTIREPLGELLLPLAGAEVYARTPADQRADKALEVIREMRDTLWKACKLPRTLRETGKVEREQLNRIAEVALDDGSIMFNPAEASLNEVKALLDKAW
ncbi:iron-containing alcohol dehydrogenase [Hahella sp. SMD15-11]|uniref:Iron-containing alcohol dehydrogenase n=1 Tax=Thermohahella caldifontis TaxID=3142973 RepID=A0AB39UX04_9GAMM